MPSFVVAISGAPGSGKTTLARRLAPALGWPLLARDTIKEALGDSLGINGKEVDESRRLGRASYAVLYAVAAESGGPVILESNFTAQSIDPVRALSSSPPVEVFCHCPAELMLHRYNSRPRHRVHHTPRVSAEEAFALIQTGPVGFGGSLIKVDTSSQPDIDLLARQVLEIAAADWAD